MKLKFIQAFYSPTPPFLQKSRIQDRMNVNWRKRRCSRGAAAVPDLHLLTLVCLVLFKLRLGLSKFVQKKGMQSDPTSHLLVIMLFVRHLGRGRTGPVALSICQLRQLARYGLNGLRHFLIQNSGFLADWEAREKKAKIGISFIHNFQ